MALEIQCVCAISENDAPGWPLSTNLMRHSQNQCVNGARAQAKVIPAKGDQNSSLEHIIESQ